MPEKTTVRRQASLCFFTCLICFALALAVLCAAVRLVPEESWEAPLAGGFLLQVAALILYAVARRGKRIFCAAAILLNTLGTGLIMAAHPTAAGFGLSAETLTFSALPMAVLLAAYILILLFPRARRWCGVGCMVLLLLLVVLLAVLWSENGAARYSIPLYCTVFVFFYSVTLVPEAEDLKTAGDYLLFSSLGALVVILIIVLAVISEGDCCDGDCGDCCDCGGGGGKRTKKRK